jgi:hypothetical protein
MSSDVPLYPYMQSNTEIIAALGLSSHPEGGFFAQTEVVPDEVASPFAGMVCTISADIRLHHKLVRRRREEDARNSDLLSFDSSESSRPDAHEQ